MFLFVVRRLLISIPILIASSFLVFGLVTISGDPCAGVAEANNPNREQLIAQCRSRLNLDASYPERYVDWSTGVVTGDLGQNKVGQDVWPILKDAMTTTVRLVLLATALSILLGLAVGILSAVRQYSAFDYSATFSAFLFFALPVFWLAVLLKQFGAIKLNDYLTRPGISLTAIAILTVLTGLFWSTVIGGSRTRRLAVGAGAGLGGLLVLWWIDASDWVTNPGLSLPVIALFSAGVAVLGTLFFGRLGNRRVLVPALVSAGAGIVGSLIFSNWVEQPTWTGLLVLFLLSIGTGLAVGALLGDIDRRAAMSAGAATTVMVGVILMADQLMSAWAPGRTIATVGPQTPNLKGEFWFRMVDYAGHQILPSLALALIGFAIFSRFTRASMLETMGSDYVRTAKAKGLPGGRVILRHGFRTALIPVTTVIAISFADVIGGAVITETVFGWPGMGRLFIEGLQEVDPYPVMGFLIVVSVTLVLFNALADIAYAYLDPRIRLD